MKRMSFRFTQILALAVIGLLATAPAFAQTAPPTSRPAPEAVAPTPMPPGQNMPAGQATTPPAAAPRPEVPRAPYLGGSSSQMPAHTHIRLDLAITDTFTGSPVKKNVSLMVLTNNGGMIRTTGADGWSNLNVDAVVAAYTNGLVSVKMTFEYTPPLGKEPTGNQRPPRLNESITVVLQDGKPMVVSQSADPATDRKVTAELTATILK